MRGTFRFIAATVFLAPLAGCGNKGDDLVRKHVELLDAKAAELEAMAQPQQNVHVRAERIAKIEKELKAVDQEMRKYSQADIDALAARHKTEIDRVVKRLDDATLAMRPKIVPKKKAGQFVP